MFNIALFVAANVATQVALRKRREEEDRRREQALKKEREAREKDDGAQVKKS